MHDKLHPVECRFPQLVNFLAPTHQDFISHASASSMQLAKRHHAQLPRCSMRLRRIGIQINRCSHVRFECCGLGGSDRATQNGGIYDYGGRCLASQLTRRYAVASPRRGAFNSESKYGSSKLLLQFPPFLAPFPPPSAFRPAAATLEHHDRNRVRNLLGSSRQGHSWI